jgi:CheY-like chemotaxis protein
VRGPTRRAEFQSARPEKDPILIAGRKLLLADDSPAVQKVIDLTFRDEGMEVTTVGDGDAALQKVEQFAPDVILADVFMPGINGYSLCEQIKQHERFARIPVILLVGSFEPFDETEARRVGADDVVTKPFQSIRELVSRVGALMGGRAEDLAKTQPLTSLGLESTGESSDEDGLDQSTVTVLVEAPLMTESASSMVTEKSSPDIELQTADTQQFPPVSSENESEVVSSHYAGERESVSTPEKQLMANQQSTEAATIDMAEVLLDLDEIRTTATASDDFILDLDTEIVAPDKLSSPLMTATAVEEHFEVAKIVDFEATGQGQARQVETELIAPSVAELPAQLAPGGDPVAQHVTVDRVSPELVDAIARRVVEQLSDKVVREIAWEVVPELAELLIKQRLEEQNR